MKENISPGPAPPPGNPAFHSLCPCGFLSMARSHFFKAWAAVYLLIFVLRLMT